MFPGSCQALPTPTHPPTFATSWYLHMLAAQLHSPATLPEAYLADSKLKSGAASMTDSNGRELTQEVRAAAHLSFGQEQSPASKWVRPAWEPAQ